MNLNESLLIYSFHGLSKVKYEAGKDVLSGQIKSFCLTQTNNGGEHKRILKMEILLKSFQFNQFSCLRVYTTIFQTYIYTLCAVGVHTVVTNIRRNDCRLLHGGISTSNKVRRRKLFRFNLVTTVV